MYLEEKIDAMMTEQKKLVGMFELFLPNLGEAKGVMHFLEITKNTFNNYITNGVFVEGIHYVKEGTKRVYIPDEIIRLKKSGVKGKRKASSKQDKLDAVNQQLGIMKGCRSAVEKVSL